MAGIQGCVRVCLSFRDLFPLTWILPPNRPPLSSEIRASRSSLGYECERVCASLNGANLPAANPLGPLVPLECCVISFGSGNFSFIAASTLGPPPLLLPSL